MSMLEGAIGNALSTGVDSFMGARKMRDQKDQAAMQQALQERQMAQQADQFGQSMEAKAAEAEAQRSFLKQQKEQEQAFRREMTGMIAASKGASGPDKNPLLDKEFELAQKYSADPQAKRAAEMGESVNKIVQSAQAKNAAGDMSLIYSFMKLNDPGSTVREGEFATAQNASGIPEQVRNAYNKALKGERLGEAQRVQFANQGIGLFESHIKSMQPINEQYGAFAKDYGVRPERVIRSYKAPERLADVVEQEEPGLLSRVKGFLRGGKGESVAAPQTGPKVGDVVEGYKYLGGDPSNPKSWSK